MKKVVLGLLGFTVVYLSIALALVTGRGKTDLDAKEDAARKTEQELLSDLGFAARHFALGDVCWIGGEGLCSVTYRPFVRPQ